MLPSVRSLASNLAINVNTVQRAYKELELEGYIYSVQGKGNFVAKINDEITKKATDELKDKLKILIKESEYLGFSKDDLINMIKDI
jgi:GntR family transcriptional regulator